MSSGRYSSRGYLVQALIAVLDSFEDPWDQIQVEPDTDNDKVDIAWYSEVGTTVCQVKSSINNFSEKKIYGILADVVTDYPGAYKYSLHLIGNGSDGLLKKMRAFSDISSLPSNLVDFKDKIHVEFNSLNLDTLGVVA